MKQLFRIFNLAVILITLSGFAFGVAPALTTVTATLTDTSGQAWINGTWRTELVPPFGNPNPPQNNGNPIIAPQTGSMDGSGTFSVVLDDNLVVTPSKTQTKFVLCPNASVNTCTTVLVTVTGATQNLTATLSAALIPVAVNASPTLTRAYASTEVNGGLGAQYANVLDSLIYQCIQQFCQGSGWLTTGASFINVITASVLPTPYSPQGALALLYPSSGAVYKGLYDWNGTNWFNTMPYDNDAEVWAIKNDCTTGITTSLQTMLDAVPITKGQSINLPTGCYSTDANTELHLRRNMVINGSCSGSIPCTTVQLGPGSNIVCDKSTVSIDGGACDFTILRNFNILLTSMSCTATATSGTLASCNHDPAAFLSLGTGDYFVAVGNATSRGSFLWRSFITPSDGDTTNIGAQVGSLTSNSITMAGGVVANFSGAVTIYKSGHVVGTGTTTNASTSVTGLTNTANYQPGDPVQGPGIKAGTFVFSRNTTSNTMVLNQAAGPAAGTGNITKGPLADVAVHAGSMVLQDTFINGAAGYAYDNNGSASYSPSTVADGNYTERNRVVNTGGACAHWAGADSNTATSLGFQCTRTIGGVIDESFLGNVHIGDQVAGGDGLPYQTTNANATSVLVGEYVEGGQQISKYGPQTIIIGGQGQSSASGGISRGVFLGADGRFSPNWYTRNEQSESTASCDNASLILYNVTNITNWFSGQTIFGGCTQSGTTVTAVDKVLNTITLSKTANKIGDTINITRVPTYFNLGTPTNNLDSVYSFGYSHDAITINYFQNKYIDPAREAISEELGSFELKYRETVNTEAWTTDDSTASWDYPITSNRGLRVFPNGVIVGGGASKADIKSFNGVTCPTSGFWHRGSLALLVSTNAGVCQETVIAKISSGAHTDIATGSTALANQDASFLGQCAPQDSIVAVGIPNATTLIDQNTLSKQATATTSLVAVTCTRQPKAHVTTQGDISNTSNTILNFTPTTGWAVNDTVRNTGLPTGTFITNISGTTVTISQNATATNTVPLTDAGFNEFSPLNMTSTPITNHVVAFDASTTPATLIDGGIRLIKFSITLSPASVAANTCAEQTLTATGVLAGDAVFINKAASQAGLGVSGVRAAGSNQIAINFCNNTALSIVPTASEVYTGGLFR